jgi:hypothetical protein
MAAGRWLGVAGEHHWDHGVVAGKVVVSRAHPNSRSTVWCDEGGSTVTFEAVEELWGSAAVARGTCSTGESRGSKG